MAPRRLILLILTSLFIVAGSYLVAARRAPAARPVVEANGSLEDAGSLGQLNTDQLITFWGDRVARDSRDYLSMGFLAQAFLRKARETGDVANYQRAETILRQAEAINPDYETTLTYLAAVLYSQHDFRGALDYATRAYKQDARQLQALATIGDAQLELGRYDEGAKTYQDLAAKAPGSAVSSRLAHLAWLQGHPDDAVRLMRQAVGEADALGLKGESAAWYHFQLGELLFNTGHPDDAATEYTTAGNLFDNYYLAFAGLGKVRAAQGRYDEAITLYERAVAIIPQPDFLAALGDVYTLAGHPADAQKQYDTVEFIGKLQAINQVIYNRQLALFRDNHDRLIPDALDLAAREYAIRKDVYGADALSWAQYKAGQYSEAAATSQAALALGTKDALLYYHAGMIAAKVGDRAKAISYLDAALALNPHFDPLQAPIARQTLDQLRAQ
jgi:tetratricopeptide (TPR) repeat protein